MSELSELPQQLHKDKTKEMELIRAERKSSELADTKGDGELREQILEPRVDFFKKRYDTVSD